RVETSERDFVLGDGFVLQVEKAREEVGSIRGLCLAAKNDLEAAPLAIVLLGFKTHRVRNIGFLDIRIFGAILDVNDLSERWPRRSDERTKALEIFVPGRNGSACFAAAPTFRQNGLYARCGRQRAGEKKNEKDGG